MLLSQEDVAVDGARVIADGAAFRSGHAWHELKFRCELTTDLTKVAAFEFSVGDAIPREDWESLGLPAVHSDVERSLDLGRAPMDANG
jgi:hypothetical protein